MPVVKGQAMPAYDPRAVQGIGVTYATSPMGADHTSSYAVTSNILEVGKVDPLKPEGQLLCQRALQIATAFYRFPWYVYLHGFCLDGSTRNQPGADRPRQCILWLELDCR